MPLSFSPSHISPRKLGATKEARGTQLETGLPLGLTEEDNMYWWVILWHSLACSYNICLIQSLPWSFHGILFLCILCSVFNQNSPAVAKAPKQESQGTRHQFYSYHTEELSDLYKLTNIFLLLLFSRQVMSNSLRPHELQHTRLPCPSLSPGVCPNSRPLLQWCYLTISSSAVWEFSFCLHSFPGSGWFLIFIQLSYSRGL